MFRAFRATWNSKTCDVNEQSRYVENIRFSQASQPCAGGCALLIRRGVNESFLPLLSGIEIIYGDRIKLFCTRISLLLTLRSTIDFFIAIAERIYCYFVYRSGHDKKVISALV